MLSTAKPYREPWSLLQEIYKLKSHEKDQRGKKNRERGRDSLRNWQKVREEVSGRRKADLLPWFPPSEYLPGWRKEIFGDSLPQILRIQTLTHTRSHALPPNFNGCIYVAEQGQPEAKLEVSCAAHLYYLLKTPSGWLQGNSVNPPRHKGSGIPWACSRAPGSGYLPEEY